jgi:hypothetical protein
MVGGKHLVSRCFASCTLYSPRRGCVSYYVTLLCIGSPLLPMGLYSSMHLACMQAHASIEVCMLLFSWCWP